jgi:hypothetical protein
MAELPFRPSVSRLMMAPQERMGAPAQRVTSAAEFDRNAMREAPQLLI